MRDVSKTACSYLPPQPTDHSIAHADPTVLPFRHSARPRPLRLSHTPWPPIIISIVASHNFFCLVLPSRRLRLDPPSSNSHRSLTFRGLGPCCPGPFCPACLPARLDGGRLGLQVERYAAVKQGGVGRGDMAGCVGRGGGEVSSGGHYRFGHEHVGAAGAVGGHRLGYCNGIGSQD